MIQLGIQIFLIVVGCAYSGIVCTSFVYRNYYTDMLATTSGYFSITDRVIISIMPYAFSFKITLCVSVVFVLYLLWEVKKLRKITIF